MPLQKTLSTKKKSVTILDLRDSPWVDGPGRTILDCADSLNKQGYRFVIGTFVNESDQEGEYATEARRRNHEVITLRERGQFDWRILTQLQAVMQTMNVDIVHTHDPRTNLVGLFCAWRNGIPVVATVHGWIANTFKRRIYRLADKIILRFFDSIISVSERTRILIRNAWIADHKITVIANALKVELYKIDRAQQEFRRELGLNKKTVLIANIGRLSPEKGHMDFLQAACIVLKTHQNVKFVLIGTGEEQERLEQFVRDNQLMPYVHFAGFRKDMVNVYNSLDLVVQSSYTEGMPNVILEAMLMQVPVIASDVGGTAEVMDNGKYGILNQPGQPIDLAGDITKYLTDPGMYRRLAENGRDSILQRYDHKTRVEKLADVYTRLLASRPT